MVRAVRCEQRIFVLEEIENIDRKKNSRCAFFHRDLHLLGDLIRGYNRYGRQHGRDHLLRAVGLDFLWLIPIALILGVVVATRFEPGTVFN